MRQRLTVTIITYNEADRIVPCLESVSFADEIIVVDAFSKDETPIICKKYGAKVVQRKWPGFVEQMNFALSLASHPWVLAIDADERISKDLKAEILQALESPNPADGYRFPRKTYYLGRWIRHSGWWPDIKLRLFKRDKGKWGGENPHYSLELEGKVKTLKNPIIHFTYRNIADHIKRINHYSDIQAKNIVKKGKKFLWLKLLLRPPFKFLQTYILQLGLLDGFPGLVIATGSAYLVFLKFAKAIELSKKYSSPDTD